VLLALRKDWGGVSLRWWTLLRERCPLKITRAVPKIVERQKRQIPEGRLCLHRGLIDLCLLALDSRSVQESSFAIKTVRRLVVTRVVKPSGDMAPPSRRSTGGREVPFMHLVGFQPNDGLPYGCRLPGEGSQNSLIP
jgi:hypothetical protein